MSDETSSSAKQPGNARWFLAAIPLILFLALAGIFYKQLASGGATSDLPSALIGKPAPATNLEPLEGLVRAGEQLPGLSPELFKGKVTVLNVWASWCAPCRVEHPFLMELAKDDRFTLAGLNYKDATENALRFLGGLGNPYGAVGVDPRGKAAIDWGVYGVPETFVVDKAGNIVFKHVGPLDGAGISNKLMPAIEQALAAQAGS